MPMNVKNDNFLADQLAIFRPNFVQTNSEFRFLFVQNDKCRDFVRFFIETEFLVF